jgi:prepilin-type N-terminal cleavage/methylation domain-containing protein
VRRSTDGGFTILELAIAMTLVATIAAIAVPALKDVMGSIRHGQAAQLVESELQQARMKAVTTNRIIRVRFNCPAAGEFRMTELIGTPAVPDAQDTASDRCSAAKYPFPPADQSIVTTPNHDGPVKRLDDSVSFGSAPTIEFRPSGAAHSVEADGRSGPPLDGVGTAVTVTMGTDVKTITVNGLGKIKGA